MPEVATRRVELNGIEIAVAEAGRGDPPLLLVHGFTGHRDDFVDRIPELGQARRVLAPDLRGHGGSTRTGRAEDFHFEQLVDDLRALLDALEIERIDLLGHSFGGMVALRFALAHPERVSSLVLMNTAPFAPDDYDPATFEKAGAIAREKGMARLQELVERASRADAEPSAEDRQTEKWADRYWAHHRRRYREMDPVAYGALGAVMLGQASLVPRLGEIRCRTTVIVGADDRKFLRGADLLAAGIPGARRVTIPEAGHHPHMENPAAWRAAMSLHGESGSSGS
jgi:pimeloyl-ACP methyl ester carboxylesterase